MKLIVLDKFIFKSYFKDIIIDGLKYCRSEKVLKYSLGLL